MKADDEDIGQSASEGDDNYRGYHCHAFGLAVVDALAEPVFVVGCHGWQKLENRKIPIAKKLIAPRISNSGLIRTRPSVVRGFSGSWTALTRPRDRDSSGSAARKQVRRSAISACSGSLASLMVKAPESP